MRTIEYLCIFKEIALLLIHIYNLYILIILVVKRMDKELVHLIKEINQVEYETNLRLTEEFSSLLNET